MSQRSIRELDKLSDRIKLHRQADPRGILVIEGPSDKRFIERLAPGQWALFPAGTRNVVISTINDVTCLCVERVAGLIDRDFDSIALKAREEGLPIFWYETADLEGFLFLDEAFGGMLNELASEQKLKSFGGISAVREKAISSAFEIAVLRAANCANEWGLPFDRVDLSRKIDRDTLALKRVSYCRALTEPTHVEVHHHVLGQTIQIELDKGNFDAIKGSLFSGKDALAVVGVALKNKIGTCSSDVTTYDHLARVLRLTAAITLMDRPPFSDVGYLIDLPQEKA
jgi:hypothetical protein